MYLIVFINLINKKTPCDPPPKRIRREFSDPDAPSGKNFHIIDRKILQRGISMSYKIVIDAGHGGSLLRKSAVRSVPDVPVCRDAAECRPP